MCMEPKVYLPQLPLRARSLESGSFHGARTISRRSNILKGLYDFRHSLVDLYSQKPKHEGGAFVTL